MRTASLVETTPDPELRKGAHAVHFYFEDRHLIELLARSVAESIAKAGPVAVIATEAHRNLLAEELERRGVDLQAAQAQGLYQASDAQEMVSRLVSGGAVDEARFRQAVGEMVSGRQRRRNNSAAPVLAFAEMVALLWQQERPEAAVKLERLWNKLMREQVFRLHCAYPMNLFQQTDSLDLFGSICEEHTAVFPAANSGPLTEDGYRRTLAQMQALRQAFEAEGRLRKSQERFQLLVESVEDYAIFLLDAGGYVASWNAGARRISGYAAGEIIGKHFSCFYPEEDVRTGKPAAILRAAEQERRCEDDGWRVRRDGSRYWASVIVTALRDRDGKLSGFAKVIRDTTDRMRADESLKDSRQRLKKEVEERIAAEKRLRESEASLRALFQLQDDERRRLGRELHDSIGQYLSALKMELECMQLEPALQEKRLRENVEGAARIAEQCIKEIRTMSYLLYPPLLEEMGLKMAVLWYLDGFSKRSGIQTRLQMPSDFGRLPRDCELVLFRILQECLTNVHRHSGSPAATVRISVDEKDAVLEVADTGRGLPTSVLELGKKGIFNTGIGMRVMQERLRGLGGKLELFSAEQGTTVRASIPCAAGEGSKNDL